MNVNDLNRTDTQKVVISQPGVSNNNATQNISISAVQWLCYSNSKSENPVFVARWSRDS